MKSKIIKLGKKNRLPDELFKEVDITHLEIIGNELAALPPELGDMSSLISLSITSKKLGSFPQEIFEINTLKIVKIKTGESNNKPTNDAVISMILFNALFILNYNVHRRSMLRYWPNI